MLGKLRPQPAGSQPPPPTVFVVSGSSVWVESPCVPLVQAYLYVVVLAQVRRLQVEVAEGQLDPEPGRNPDVPAPLQ